MHPQRFVLLIAGFLAIQGSACGGRIAPEPSVDPPELAAVVNGAPAAAAPRSAAPQRMDHLNPFHAGDDWRGIYTCAQGLTNVDLKIVAMHDNTIDDALFDFDWISGNVTGSYHLSGTFDPETATATLTPRAWVDQPSGWYAVGMKGSAGAETYAGSITDSACGTFAVQRL